MTEVEKNEFYDDDMKFFNEVYPSFLDGTSVDADCDMFGTTVERSIERPRAIEIFRMMIEKHPRVACNYTFLGPFLLRDGQIEEAVEVFEKAVIINAFNGSYAYGLLAEHFEKAGDEAAAKKYRALEELVRHCPDELKWVNEYDEESGAMIYPEGWSEQAWPQFRAKNGF